MLKVKLLVLLCFFTLAAVAQLPVRLSGTAQGWKNGSMVSLFSYQGYLVDTVKLIHHKFSMKESIPGGDFYTLRIGDREMPAIKDSLLFYLDAGTMKLRLSRNNAPGTRFRGSLFARQLDSFNKIVIKTSTLNKDQRIHALRSWILHHRRSPVSVFAIDRYLAAAGDRIHWSDLHFLYSRLRPSALDNILALRLGLTIERLNTLESGHYFPSFTLPDSAGKLFRLDRDEGNYLLIDFWASWCGPCREENPHLKQIAAKYAGKNLTLISISLDKNVGAWTGAIHTDNLNWVQLIDKDFPRSPLTQALNLKMIPADFLLDPGGKIIAKSLFGIALDTELDHLLIH